MGIFQDERNVEVENYKSIENGNQLIGGGDRPSKHFMKRFLQYPCDEDSKIIEYLTLIIISLVLWIFLYTLLQDEVKPPAGQLFVLVVLTGSSYFCGWLISFLRLPPILGMLLCGISARYLGFFNLTGVYTEVVVTIREVALTSILILAGLGLDATALKKLSLVVARLAIIPCFAEAIGAAIAAYFVMGMPWIWGLLLGFALSAVSPAIVIPVLQILKGKGFGESKGISTLIVAASSLDDVVCISIFGILLGVIFSAGSLWSNITHGPIEVAIGIVVGLAWGFLSACIPHRNENYVTVKRSLMIGAGGLVFVLGGQMIGYNGAGPLAAIISSFLASMCWKWQGWSNTHNPVEDVFSHIWTILEPLLLGLIGTEINFADIGLQSLWQALAVLGICSICRIIACSVVVLGGDFNLREILFVNLAWLPKATVQAALGPVALDLAKQTGQKDAIGWSQDVLTIVVLSIVITAPIGAVGMMIGGPKLLIKDSGPVKVVVNGHSDRPVNENANHALSVTL